MTIPYEVWKAENMLAPVREESCDPVMSPYREVQEEPVPSTSAQSEGDSFPGGYDAISSPGDMESDGEMEQEGEQEEEEEQEEVTERKKDPLRTVAGGVKKRATKRRRLTPYKKSKKRVSWISCNDRCKEDNYVILVRNSARNIDTHTSG